MSQTSRSPSNSPARSIPRPSLSLRVARVLLAAGLSAAAVSAQPVSTEPRLEVYPNPARALEPVRVVFSWFSSSCTGEPFLVEKETESGRTILELIDPGCPLLPPGGYEYTLVKEIEIPGGTTVEVRQYDDQFVAEVEVEVTPTDPDQLDVRPIRNRFEDTERTRVRVTGNNGGCLVELAGIDFGPTGQLPSDGATPVEIRLERGCILDPPLARNFVLEVELGRLPPGLYSVAARFEEQESSRTDLLEVYVDSTPPSLSISPTEPVDTDALQVGITRAGTLVCDPEPEVLLTGTRIEVRVDSDCWGAPFEQNSTLFAGVDPRPAGRYLLILLDRETDAELDRRVFDVEPKGECIDSITSLCLLRNRFQATAIWRTTQGTQGPGHALVRNDGNSAASGTFWFFDPNSVEIDLKVINGCNVNGHFWVFAAGLTDQGVVLRVVDTVTGFSQVYGTSPGAPFPTVTDIEALACF